MLAYVYKNFAGIFIGNELTVKISVGENWYFYCVN